MQSQQERRRRAWALAEQLACLGREVERREGADLVRLGTAELARAMGHEEVRLEELRQFVLDVIELMQGRSVHVVCGCGCLFLMVGAQDVVERTMAEQRELTVHEPPDWSAYFDAFLVERLSSPRRPVVTACGR